MDNYIEPSKASQSSLKDKNSQDFPDKPKDVSTAGAAPTESSIVKRQKRNKLVQTKDGGSSHAENKEKEDIFTTIELFLLKLVLLILLIIKLTLFVLHSAEDLIEKHKNTPDSVEQETKAEAARATLSQVTEVEKSTQELKSNAVETEKDIAKTPQVDKNYIWESFKTKQLATQSEPSHTDL